MAVHTSSPVLKTRRRHTPTSKAAFYWFLFAAVYCIIFYVLYGVVFKAPVFTGPWFDRIFRVGVMSYIMTLAAAAYSLRTRFMRNLPWKAQNWVWMHMALGITSVLLALLHASYSFVLHWDCTGQENCFTAHYWGMPSLYALIFIAFSGVVGRLLDKWQARIIAQDASKNGVGIAKAITDRLNELESIVERCSAGKSQPFKEYCTLALEKGGKYFSKIPELAPDEQVDFRYAYATLKEHARLTQSLGKQKRACSIFRAWRYVHVSLVPLALLIITYHGIAELLTNVLHLIKV